MSHMVKVVALFMLAEQSLRHRLALLRTFSVGVACCDQSSFAVGKRLRSTALA
jgi:hypothetical protein